MSNVKHREIHAGDAGEHLVCSDILMEGYQAFQCGQGMAWDVGAEIGGSVVKFQVKSTNTVHTRKNRNPHFRFSTHKGQKRVAYNPCDYDILALVDLKNKKIIYLTDVYDITNLSIRCSDFNDSCNTLESAIYDLHEGKL